jgi:hypothetical protein
MSTDPALHLHFPIRVYVWVHHSLWIGSSCLFPNRIRMERVRKEGRLFRARFESVRALRFLLHTLSLRYFCSGKIHKFCCKIAFMHAELTLFVKPSLKVSWLPSEVYVFSGDLSKRALSEKGSATVMLVLRPGFRGWRQFLYRKSMV